MIKPEHGRRMISARLPRVTEPAPRESDQRGETLRDSDGPRMMAELMDADTCC